MRRATRAGHSANLPNASPPSPDELAAAWNGRSDSTVCRSTVVPIPSVRRSAKASIRSVIILVSHTRPLAHHLLDVASKTARARYHRRILAAHEKQSVIRRTGRNNASKITRPSGGVIKPPARICSDSRWEQREPRLKRRGVPRN